MSTVLDGLDRARLLTYQQLSDLTGWSNATIHRRRRDGSLPVVHLGPRSTRFPLVAVLQLVDNAMEGR